VLRVLSAIAFAAMVAGVAGLLYYGALFASHPALRVIQVTMVALMVAARITVGRHSVLTAADSAKDGLVTTGPYAYLRHPIYAATIHFIWAGAVDHFSWPVLGWAETVTAGAFTRMHIEEHLLIRKCPEYRAYRKRAKKLIPFVY
jgi:protein-S-isoprenylcysteine O-methyltransferase Ste14